MTVKVATPEAFVVPETVVITELPLDAVSWTTLPATPLATVAPSFNVTVMVDVLVPLAATEEGLATTAELALLMGTTVRVAEAVPSVPETVLTRLPAVVGRTETVAVHVLPAVMDPPARVSELPPEVPVTVPEQPVPLSVPVAAAAFTSPLG